ncbi:cation channel sperm-associated auxiliary subunit TMEM249 isoform X3 [Peromyscus maniculatus bairdii]|uniref:cation channel sperm-associated auxiliary subunit TMEM249 isoform X3 n=1 Tax=Peromyscus maniculatus bairdii TaxID=230844 RepID=UPI003FD03FB2
MVGRGLGMARRLEVERLAEAWMGEGRHCSSMENLHWVGSIPQIPGTLQRLGAAPGCPHVPDHAVLSLCARVLPGHALEGDAALHLLPCLGLHWYPGTAYGRCFFQLVLCGHKLEPLVLVQLSERYEQMEFLGRHIARKLNINYFDYLAASYRHVVRHWPLGATFNPGIVQRKAQAYTKSSVTDLDV